MPPFERPELAAQPEVAEDVSEVARRPVRRREPAPVRGEPAHAEGGALPARRRGPERPERRERPREERPERKGGEATPRAFGDHMPAFLRRPVRVSAD
jgi:hypothetical protein